jgi:hypothetical protein
MNRFTRQRACSDSNTAASIKVETKTASVTQNTFSGIRRYVRRQPTDGQQVRAKDPDDHRAIEHRAGHGKLGLRQPSPSAPRESSTTRPSPFADQPGDSGCAGLDPGSAWAKAN